MSTEIAPEIDAGINRDHDLIIMNQRGQFLSIPALTCLPIDEFDRELLGLRFYSPQTKRKHVRATADCRDELQATGANLPSYNSTENAADFADLRTALGISQWNVFGLSYGTDLAHPNLEANVTNLVNMLKAAPLTTATPDPVTGEPVTVVVDGGSLLDWIRDQGRTNTMLTRVPAVIDELAQGTSAAWCLTRSYRSPLRLLNTGRARGPGSTTCFRHAWHRPRAIPPNPKALTAIAMQRTGQSRAMPRYRNCPK